MGARDSFDVAIVGAGIVGLACALAATDRGKRAVVIDRDRVEDASVARAVADGWSWAQIAEALGVTRQAVHKKHARRLSAAGIKSGDR